MVLICENSFECASVQKPFLRLTDAGWNNEEKD
jgi:hypothetical protein